MERASDASTDSGSDQPRHHWASSPWHTQTTPLSTHSSTFPPSLTYSPAGLSSTCLKVSAAHEYHVPLTYVLCPCSVSWGCLRVLLHQVFIGLQAQIEYWCRQLWRVIVHVCSYQGYQAPHSHLLYLHS